MRVCGEDRSNLLLIYNLFYSFNSKEANVKNTDNRGYKLGKLLPNPKSFGFVSAGFVFRELQNK